jgi:hypothetical protein
VVTPPPLPPAQPPRLPQPPAVVFYYNANGKPVGPLSLAEIQAKIASGEIRPDTLVWRTGAARWMAAKDFPDIAPLLPKEVDLKAFFVGTWETQAAGPPETTGPAKLTITATADGNLQGTYAVTLKDSGALVNIPISGSWSLEKTGEKRFTLNLVLKMQSGGQMKTLPLSSHLEIVDDNTLRDVDSGTLAKRIAKAQ